MEENKKKVSSREAWRLHRRAAKLFYAERPALHAVNWLYAAFKSLSPYVLIYLSAQIIGELTGTRDAHRLTVLAALERRQTVLYDNSFYINQKIYANKLLDMDFPQLDDPKTHDDLSQILQNEKWSGYGLGRVLDVETKLPMSVFGVLGVVALTVTLFTQRVPESAGAWTVLNHPRRSRGLATGFSTSLRSWRSATATARATSACITSRTSARAMLRPIRRSVRTARLQSLHGAAAAY